MSGRADYMPVQSEPTCTGTHRYYAAETGVVLEEGKVCVVIVCTSCGESKLISHTVVGNLQLKK